MKKLILYALSAALVMMASCQKSPVTGGNDKGEGTLSFSSFALEVDETVLTRAEGTAAPGTYQINILDADGKEYLSATYNDIKNNNNQISLPAGNYTLMASSSGEDVPYAEFENPIYGVSKDFSIAAGEVTEIGALTCTLLQCKVTVTYSDEFLSKVTGDCTTQVSLKRGYPLTYNLGADKKYDLRAGYFLVEGTTLEVKFQGSFEGQNKKMTSTLTGIAPKQWRQIQFVMKENEQGDATFDIVIAQMVDDGILNGSVSVEEEGVFGDDPEKPLGDGGITLYPDYEAGCDAEIADLNNIIIASLAKDGGRDMSIKLKAEVPNGIRKFNVSITTDNQQFANACAAAGADNLDLINPKPENEAIFKVVPFENGPQLLGKTEVAFDLSKAQGAILNYPGNHTFIMTILDETGCSKVINVTMVVE